MKIFASKNFSLLCVAISAGGTIISYQEYGLILSAACALLVGACARNYWEADDWTCSNL